MLSKEFGAKAGATVSNIYRIQLKKKYLLSRKRRPAQVFSRECCEIFKNTYFEKHLRKAASENQNVSRLVFSRLLDLRGSLGNVK